jgi:eukaryotic-like serine/threonine-protein kinase
VDDAVRCRQQAASGSWCRICGLVGLGRAYERAGEPDSAIAAYERYVTTPDFVRSGLDAIELGAVYQRLGELYEARGNRAKAAQYYTRLVQLWKDCDPELRPEVARAQRRLKALAADPRL